MISGDGKWTVVRAALVAALLGLRCLSAEAVGNTSIDEVWGREDTYWQLSAHGSVDDYLALWHPDALAWPPDTAHPLSKAALAERLATPGQPRLGLASPLTREAAKDFGATVIVYYEATQQRSYPDGHRDAPRRVKVTHVWQKVGTDWLLIGGQAAPL